MLAESGAGVLAAGTIAGVEVGATAASDDAPPVLAAGSAAVASGTVAPAPPRKSVTYQPVPLSWKPAAVTCFLKAALLQDGQTVSGSSNIFGKTTGFAAIRINRHGKTSQISYKTMNYKVFFTVYKGFDGRLWRQRHESAQT